MFYLGESKTALMTVALPDRSNWPHHLFSNTDSTEFVSEQSRIYG